MAKYVKYVRITGAARTALTREITLGYIAGASIRALADRHSRSYGFIHYTVIESGTPMRTPGGSRPGHKKAAQRPSVTART